METGKIIGFVRFVANLLSRLADGAMVGVRKRATFRPCLKNHIKRCTNIFLAFFSSEIIETLFSVD
jgi:hypothetical protein